MGAWVTGGLNQVNDIVAQLSIKKYISDLLTHDEERFPGERLCRWLKVFFLLLALHPCFGTCIRKRSSWLPTGAFLLNQVF